MEDRCPKSVREILSMSPAERCDVEGLRNQLAQAKAENVQLRIQIRKLQQVASNARGWAK